MRNLYSKHPRNTLMNKLSAAFLLACMPVLASANIIPTFIGATGAAGGPYTWDYAFTLSSDQDAHSGVFPTTPSVSHTDLSFGAFVTIYDFAGYVAGSCTSPAGWTCSAQNVGFTPDDVLPSDDSGETNVTWVYTSGPDLLGAPAGLELGRFTAVSLYSAGRLDSYTARGIKNNGPAKGTIADNVGETLVPMGVPEPGTLVLAGAGLLMLSRRLVKRAAD